MNLDRLKTTLRVLLHWKVAGATGAFTVAAALMSQAFNATWVPIVCGIIGFISAFAGMTWLESREKTTKLAWSLKRHLAPNAMAYFEKHPERLDMRDRNAAMTIVSFDIPGLKESLETFDPTIVFPKIRELKARINRITHAYGGVIIPGYHQGFLCMFGDTLFQGHTNQRHAEAALQAAAEIQRLHSLDIRASFGQKEPVLSLRCGITSSRGFIANLDLEDADFNCFGEGVDDALTLQKACDPGSILFTRLTRDLMVGVDVHSDAFQKRFINDKDNSDAISEVYEYDPLSDTPELRAALLQTVRDNMRHERHDVRWQVKNPHILLIETNIGPAEIINISKGGVGITLQDKVTIGTVIRLTFSSTDAALRKRLENRGLTSFGMEVRWTSLKNNLFTTGLAFKNVAEADRVFLLQCILESKAFDGHQTA